MPSFSAMLPLILPAAPGLGGDAPAAAPGAETAAAFGDALAALLPQPQPQPAPTPPAVQPAAPDGERVSDASTPSPRPPASSFVQTSTVGSDQPGPITCVGPTMPPSVTSTLTSSATGSAAAAALPASSPQPSLPLSPIAAPPADAAQAAGRNLTANVERPVPPPATPAGPGPGQAWWQGTSFANFVQNGQAGIPIEATVGNLGRILSQIEAMTRLSPELEQLARAPTQPVFDIPPGEVKAGAPPTPRGETPIVCPPGPSMQPAGVEPLSSAPLPQQQTPTVQGERVAEPAAGTPQAAASEPPRVLEQAAGPDSPILFAAADMSGSSSSALTPEAAAPPRATSETAAGLAVEMARRLEARQTRFDLALTPEGLGRVEVSVAINRDGALSAALTADGAYAAAELNARSGELRDALREAGFDVAREALTFTSRDGGEGGAQARRDDRSAPQAPAYAAINEAVDEPVLAELSRRLNTGRGALDVRI